MITETRVKGTVMKVVKGEDMKKRTMQEIADFFGVHVAMNGNGRVYVFEKEPTGDYDMRAWIPDGGFHFRIGSNVVERDDNMEWDESLAVPATLSEIENVPESLYQNMSKGRAGI